MMNQVVRQAGQLAGGLLRSSRGAAAAFVTPIFSNEQANVAGKRNISDRLVLNKKITKRFLNLPGERKNVFLTYVWIDGTGEHLRAKTKVSKKGEPTCAEDCGDWGYDGSSTYQATGEESDLTIRPVAMCPDPFFGGKSKILMCEVYDAHNNPVETNRRHSAHDAIQKTAKENPTFGFEQEYTLLDPTNQLRPFGFPSDGFPGPQGPYYCGVGAGLAVGRDICDTHLVCCDYAGLNVWGTNAEVMPGQWEFQTGPLAGIWSGDNLWLARYMLLRVAEEFGVAVTFDPKPFEGDWNGAGCHTNFNTDPMLEAGGDKLIYEAIKKLERNHDKHIKGYDPKGGVDNLRRLTGRHETARIDQFTYGEGARTASVRIPASVATRGRGYLEDRRPAANMDPYTVMDLLIRTCCLNE